MWCWWWWDYLGDTIGMKVEYIQLGQFIDILHFCDAVFAQHEDTKGSDTRQGFADFFYAIVVQVQEDEVWQ